MAATALSLHLSSLPPVAAANRLDLASIQLPSQRSTRQKPTRWVPLPVGVKSRRPTNAYIVRARSEAESSSSDSSAAAVAPAGTLLSDSNNDSTRSTSTASSGSAPTPFSEEKLSVKESLILRPEAVKRRKDRREAYWKEWEGSRSNDGSFFLWLVAAFVVPPVVVVWALVQSGYQLGPH